ncbi:MAG TPA: hypothetical protein VIL24_05635 [Clostridia bacterium]
MNYVYSAPDGMLYSLYGTDMGVQLERYNPIDDTRDYKTFSEYPVDNKQLSITIAQERALT